MTIEAEVAALTVATTDLLTAVNVGKTELDAAVSAAEGSATNASNSAAAAAGYVVPPLSGNAGKLLAVNGLATATEWVPPPEPGGLEVANWAALLALTGIPDGRVYTVMAPLITGGAPGTLWKRDSASLSGWRPANTVRHVFTTQIDRLPDTAETVIWQRQLPAGALAGAASLWVHAKLFYSGAADTGSRTIRLRIGPNGTTADTMIATNTPLNTARQSQISSATSPRGTSLLVPQQYIVSSSPQVTRDLSGSTTGVNGSPYSVDLTQSLWVSLTALQAASPADTISLDLIALEIS